MSRVKVMSLCCKKSRSRWRKIKWGSTKMRIFIMMALIVTFFFVEIVAGELVQSNAVKADAYHMLSDLVALLVAYFSVIFAPKKWNRNTYGFARAEVLGALANSVFLMALCFEIFIQCLRRYLKPQPIEEDKIELLLFVGIVGLVINLLGLFMFHDHNEFHKSAANDFQSHRHGQYVYGKDNERQLNASNSSLNIKGVFLHIMADALGSIVIIISAVVYIFTKELSEEEFPYRPYIDPTLSLLLVLLIVCSTWPLFKESAMIMLQTMPDDIQIKSMSGDLKSTLPEIENIHDFHIWQLVHADVVATIHVRLSKKLDTAEHMAIATKAKEFFHKHGIHATTVQFEYPLAPQQQTNKQGCALPCPSSAEGPVDDSGGGNGKDADVGTDKNGGVGNGNDAGFDMGQYGGAGQDAKRNNNEPPRLLW